MPQNLIEKIAQLAAIGLEQGEQVQSGDFIFISPRHMLTHDNTAAVMGKFMSLGAGKIHDPRQPVFVLDHNVQDTSPENLTKYEHIEKFAQRSGVDFYPAGRGIGHQVMCEEGYVWPGTFVVASDSHANMYGALGALGTPLVRTDAAAIWATGRTWWQVPPVARVELTGKLTKGVTAKDVMLTLTSFFNQNEVLNHAIEFAGDGLECLDMDGRFTLANMTTEWGALTGLFPIDAQTYSWLESRALALEKRGLAGVASDDSAQEGRHPRLNFDRVAELKHSAPFADPDAAYARELTLDLSSIAPCVVGPDNVKTRHAVAEISKEQIEIQKAYLLSCVNARTSDLAAAAKVLEGKQVSPHVELYVSAASSEIQAEAETQGVWQTLLDAGAIMLPSGCGPCIGLGEGLLAPGEVGISATNRNFKGRMGDRSAQCYLASPEVVAASAASGYITGPNPALGIEAKGSSNFNQLPAAHSKQGLVEGFKPAHQGKLVFCHQNDLNTDGIFPGKYTYREDWGPEEMAQVVMENYDPGFRDLVTLGDILVGGYNFGMGSSREQAVTALKQHGVALLLVGSVAATYKRNAINNGFLVLEAPALVEDLLSTYGRERPTVATQQLVKVDLENGRVEFQGKRFAMEALGKVAQEILMTSGLENWVKEKLR